jgi:anion-transporting  ArsA/GET3 family ATPase
MSSNLLNLLKKNKVLICVGSGGVGKTTVSAALGVRAAQLGLRVLVMTIDPAQRLKVALGLNATRGQKMRVPDQHYAGEIFASLLNAEEIFQEFVFSAADDKAKAEKLTQNRLYQQLSTTLSGSQEFTSLLQLSRMVETNEFDLVILDTPPAQHAIDFLEAPEKISALFKETIVRWFIGEWENANFIKRIISRGTQTALSALELITGSQFMIELNDFFKSVGAVQSKINEYSEHVKHILRRDSTGFLLVTGFDEAKLIEAGNLKKYLEDSGYHLRGAIINRAFPVFDSTRTPVAPSLQMAYEEWMRYHAKREAQFQNFVKGWGEQLPIVRVPDFNNDIQGLQGIEVIAHELDKAFTNHNSGGMRAGR